MRQFTFPRFALLLLALGLLSCQTRPEVSYEDYHIQKAALEKASEENTVSAYNGFLKEYPDSAWTEKATFFRDELAFNAARKEGTAEGFKTFLASYPGGAFQELAEDHLFVIEYEAEHPEVVE